MPTPAAGKVARLAVAAVLLAASCSDTSPPDATQPAPPEPAVPPAATSPPTVTPEPELAAPPEPEPDLPPPTEAVPPTTVAPPEPPSRPAADSQGESCHPAYGGCLLVLEGDALDCDNIPEDQWPITIWDPSNDPYQLGDGQSFLACLPPAEVASAGEAPEATETQPAPTVPTSEPVYTPPPANAAEDPSPESGEVAESLPPPAPAPPVGDPGTGPAPPRPEPETAPPPADTEEPDGAPAENTQPSTQPEPEAAEEPAQPSTEGPTTTPTTLYVDTGEPESCGGDTGRPCDPPQVGETIVITAGHPDTNPDIEFYCDSGEPVGDGCTFGQRIARTARAYPVSVGTRIRILDPEHPDRSWTDLVVLCVTDEPVERTEALTEEVWGATMRSTIRRLDLIRPGRPEAFYGLYPGPNGRWHLRLGSPLGSARDC